MNNTFHAAGVSRLCASSDGDKCSSLAISLKPWYCVLLFSSIASFPRSCVITYVNSCRQRKSHWLYLSKRRVVKPGFQRSPKRWQGKHNYLVTGYASETDRSNLFDFDGCAVACASYCPKRQDEFGLPVIAELTFAVWMCFRALAFMTMKTNTHKKLMTAAKRIVQVVKDSRSS